MAVVIASNLRKDIAGSLLFEGVSFSVERGDRLSLSGPNGAGKTTLLRILAGETDLHGGELVFAKDTRVALHDQRPPIQSGLSLREYALEGAADLAATEDELRTLEQAMADGDHGAATLARYAEAQARLEHAGGYDWRERAARTLRGLGFLDKDLDRPLATFSGGELTRASLARALAGDPDLLLLDEPTNHLDVANLEWLEQELQSLDAAVILVAHDRWFLEAVTTGVLELEAGRSLFFPGPWHVWRLEKAARAAAAAKTAERVGVDIARLERFVERFRYKKSKAKQAQAKLTHIARLEEERADAAGEFELLTRKSKSLGFDFLKPSRSGRTVLEAKDLAIAAGERTCSRARRSPSSAASTSASSGRTARGRPRFWRRSSVAASRSRARSGSATASRPRTSRSTRSSWTSAAACSTARSARPGCRGHRRSRFSGVSSSRAGRHTRSRLWPFRVVSGAGSRSR